MNIREGCSGEFTSHSFEHPLSVQFSSFSCTFLVSSGSSGRIRGGPRNTKSMWSPLVAIFFMTYFHRAGGGGHGPLGPPGSATASKTRMHSSRMRTARLLTVSQHVLRGGRGVPAWGCMYLPGGCVPAGGGVYLPWGVTVWGGEGYLPGGVSAQVPPL